MNARSVCAIVLTGTALWLGSSPASAGTIRCESTGGNYQSCAVDTRGGVRLSRQLSSKGCWQNDTWGYERNRIWVDRGCRAEFSVGESSSGSSHDNKVAGAVVLGLVAAAVIASQHDDHHNGRNDRYDDGYDDRYGNYGGNPSRIIRCESKGSRFTYCSIPSRGHVEVYKQLSSSSCSYGRSWGTERGRIWVDDGCRADFAVY